MVTLFPPLLSATIEILLRVQELSDQLLVPLAMFPVIFFSSVALSEQCTSNGKSKSMEVFFSAFP